MRVPTYPRTRLRTLPNGMQANKPRSALCSCASDQGNMALADAIRAQIRLYQSGVPYRVTIANPPSPLLQLSTDSIFGSSNDQEGCRDRSSRRSTLVRRPLNNLQDTNSGTSGNALPRHLLSIGQRIRESLRFRKLARQRRER
jgi:hypothetical protein